MPLLASITQPLIDWAVGVVGDLGLWGIFLLSKGKSAWWIAVLGIIALIVNFNGIAFAMGS